jgi:Spy/CpxP family protein refolding chaperone
MKSIRFRFMAAALVVLLGAMIANSQTATVKPVHGHEWGHGHMMGFFADYLDLSDAQRAQMKSILQKERPTLTPLVQQLHQTRQQLHQFEEGTFDEAKVRALATQQAQTEVELTVQKTRIHNELFQVLTSDQQAKMKEFEARHEAHRQAWMQRRQSEAPAAPEQ